MKKRFVGKVIGGFSVILLMLLSIRILPIEDLSFSAPPTNEITESVQIDLEYTNQMFPSINGTKLIEQHLTAIRKQYPMLEDVEYCNKWIVGELIVYNFKTSADDCIELINNSEYGPVSFIEPMYNKRNKFVKFPMLFNPEKIAPIIRKLCDASAKPNRVSCWDGGYLVLDYLSETESRYTFSKGYGDCPSGCMYKHYWQFTITSTGITLANEWETGDKSLDGLY